jgi:hypothetical protein
LTMVEFTPVGCQFSVDQQPAELIIGRRRQHRLVGNNLARAQKEPRQDVEGVGRRVVGVGLVNCHRGAGKFAWHAAVAVAVQLEILPLCPQHVILDLLAQRANDLRQDRRRIGDTFPV